MKIRFIGDIHGNVEKYRNLLLDCDTSIQVGDFGAGFTLLPSDVPLTHRFIRGNHDSPSICRQSDHWIKDGTWDEKHKMFFIGGAYSIDQAWRTPGVSWWTDEELSIVELNGLISEYEMRRPEIMVTHDCPEIARILLFNINEPTRTTQALQTMFEIHQPKLWIFGHHHTSRDTIIKGTRFVCLAEFQYMDIDIDGH